MNSVERAETVLAELRRLAEELRASTPDDSAYFGEGSYE